LLAPPHERVHQINVPGKDGSPPDMRALVAYLRDKLIQEREELFVEGDSVFVCLGICIDAADPVSSY